MVVFDQAFYFLSSTNNMGHARPDNHGHLRRFDHCVSDRFETQGAELDRRKLAPGGEPLANVPVVLRFAGSGSVLPQIEVPPAQRDNSLGGSSRLQYLGIDVSKSLGSCAPKESKPQATVFRLFRPHIPTWKRFALIQQAIGMSFRKWAVQGSNL